MGRARLTSFLLDTHIWAWDLKLDAKLPPRLIHLIDSSTSTHVSVVSLYEISQKVRIGKWPEMATVAKHLATTIAEQGYLTADVTAPIAQRAGLLDWNHRDPFDRILAATAIELQLPMISADIAFDELASLKEWPGRIW